MAERENKTAPLAIRITQTMKARLDEIALEEQRSLASLVAKIIADYLAAKDKK
jgi:predicted transcriptional regulator